MSIIIFETFYHAINTQDEYIQLSRLIDLFTVMIVHRSEIPLSFNGIYKVAVAVQRQRVLCAENSEFASPALGSAHFHVSRLSDFIFYQKPLYKSLHQSFFYSLITILTSESGVTLHYSTF